MKRLAFLVAGAAAPSLVSLGPVRAAVTPRLVDEKLSGISNLDHIALTFDDGPDGASTPHFLELLSEYDVRATFFVLGAHVADHRGLVGELSARGHELAVHGWDHRPVVAHTPTALRGGIARTRDLLEEITGSGVTRYRPPYGVVAPHAFWAARRLGLDTVLWSAWGRDWERRATPNGVARLVRRDLRPGGTVLLHDSDRTSAPGSWRTTLAATRLLLETWRAQGRAVGPLSEHWVTTLEPARAHPLGTV